MDISEIDAALSVLASARDHLSGHIADWAVLGIARAARDTVPEVATVRLRWTAEGDAAFMRPAGFYAADGTDLREEPPYPGMLATLDTLATSITPFCGYLDETNSGTWGSFTTGNGPDGEELSEDDHRLYVALPLAITAPESPGVMNRPGIPAVIDARDGGHRRPHPCPGTWWDQGVNAGGHEVFGCTGVGDHRLIAAHPDPQHRCTSTCGQLTALPAA